MLLDEFIDFITICDVVVSQTMQEEDKDDCDIPTIASTTAMSQITTADILGDHDNFNDSSAKHIERV